jgi:hypothetical protein
VSLGARGRRLARSSCTYNFKNKSGVNGAGDGAAVSPHSRRGRRGHALGSASEMSTPGPGRRRSEGAHESVRGQTDVHRGVTCPVPRIECLMR